MSTAPVYCVNHPKTETLLRCNKCGNPVCIKCVVRTPVGYRCKTCMNIQQAGYYNATSLDYVIVAVVGMSASMMSGAIALAVGGFWFIAIFYGPLAGGAIAEVIRWAIQRRRAKYIWLVACATVVLGAFLVAGALPLFLAIGTPNFTRLLASGRLFGTFLNLGLWIYLVLAVSTVYARLKS